MTWIAQRWKAFAGGIAAGIAYAIPVVDDGLTVSEALGIALAALIGWGVTWAVPNRQAQP